MISITDKQNCCGCSACASVCPKQCISMQADNEGFLYPVVDTDKCIDCGLCEKVCPFMNQGNENKPMKVYAAQCKDESIKLKSSSGGVFSLLATAIIEEGGVVFGVKFDDDWQPVFGYAETVEELEPFRGSKYVQAVVGNAYIDARTFLKQGRKVLFSGTSCQIAGLKRFLKTEYENLLTVDVVCHGAPSPMVWEQYLQEIKMSDRREDRGKNTVLSSSKEIPVITGISFRDKNLGWQKYSFVVWGESAIGGQNSVLLSDMHRENRFMQAFLSDLILRPSCYVCKAKAGSSGSDITIADYWGVSKFHPEMDDDKGTSLVLVNTKNGGYWTDRVLPQLEYVESDYSYGLAGNPSIEKSVKVPKYRKYYWKKFPSCGIRTIDLVKKKKRYDLVARTENYLKRIGRVLLSHLKIKKA